MTAEPPDDWRCAFCIKDDDQGSMKAIMQADATVMKIETMKKEAMRKKKDSSDEGAD